MKHHSKPQQINSVPVRVFVHGTSSVRERMRTLSVAGSAHLMCKPAQRCCEALSSARARSSLLPQTEWASPIDCRPWSSKDRFLPRLANCTRQSRMQCRANTAKHSRCWIAFRFHEASRIAGDSARWETWPQPHFESVP